MVQLRLVDLSHVFRPGMLHGSPAPELDVSITKVKSLETDGMNVLQFHLAEHVGTHIDAPVHIIDGGATMGDVPIEHFYGPAVILDMRRGGDEAIGVDDLREASPAIEAGDIVFLETGWSDRMGTEEYAVHHPYLDPEAAEWLVRQRVAMVGIDVSSLDLPHSLRKPGFRHHTLRILLEGGVPALHGLTNLSAVRGRRCTVAALPVIFEGAGGGPARVVAILDEEPN